MTNITFSVPRELHIKMRKFQEIKWSVIARNAIEQRIKNLEIIERIVSKSKLTKKDAEEIAKKIDSGVAKNLRLK